MCFNQALLKVIVFDTAFKMSTQDENTKAEAMSETVKLNDGQVPQGSAASEVQSAVDQGQTPQQGLSQGMSNEGQQTGGTYSQSTSVTQSVVDKNN